MVCAAWCEVPLLQGLGQPPTAEPAMRLTAPYCGSLETSPWLLPLTLSTLLREEPWAPIVGKVSEKNAKSFFTVILEL